MGHIIKKRRLTIAAVAALILLVASYIPTSWNIPFLTSHNRALAVTRPYLNLPWNIGDKDSQGNPIYFTGGPHGAPVVFACQQGGVRPESRLSGLDFAMAVGTDVLAVADGWVTFASQVSDPRGMYVVAIDTGDGFATEYWHLNSIDPAIFVNEWISQGTRIGKSGIGDGHPHLHLETRFYRNPSQPPYPRDASTGLPYPEQGAQLGPYTVRSEVALPGSGKGLNYNGNLTLGQESTVNGTDCNGTIKVKNWIGSQATITASASPGPAQIVTGSTNTPPTTQPSVTVQDAWTTGADNNKRNPPEYNLGEEIRFFATVNNTTNSTVTATFVWQAVGPRQIMSVTADESLPPGSSTWYLPGTIIPNDAWEANYSFRAQVIYNSVTNGLASGFTITAPTPTPPQYHIVLTWPAGKADLDSHLWLPTAQQYHVYYAALGDLNGFPGAALDQDDVSSPGMETIGISQLQQGTYYYAVYNFGNKGSLRGSNASARLYQNGSMTQELQAPLKGNGQWWDIFRIIVNPNGSVNITVVNKIVSACPGPYDCHPLDDSHPKPLSHPTPPPASLVRL